MTHIAQNARAKIDKNPYDVDAWNVLLREKQKDAIEDAREFYEQLISRFPNAGRYWKAYVEHELKSKNIEAVEKIFARCLTNVLHIDLWKTYLNYVRQAKGDLPEWRERIAEMYEWALDKVGLDISAYSIYADYVAFLKALPTKQAHEFQRISAIRKIYVKGVTTPILNIEQLWADYCQFEKSVNANLADKLIADKAKDFSHAKKNVKALEQAQRGLQRNAVSVPPRYATAQEAKQIELWKRYIQWEKENPTSAANNAIVVKRVTYAYEQALLCIGYHPDLWYEAAFYLQQSAQDYADKGESANTNKLNDEVAALYERATTTMMVESALIHFAYADYEEQRMRYKKTEEIYRRFLANPAVDPTLAYVHYMKFARRTEGIKHSRAVFKQAREDHRTHYHAYVAAAMTEFYCSKDANIALNIFNLGLKKFSDEVGYARAYLDFVMTLNDDANTRVLFEKILTSGNLPADKSVVIWDMYLAFESRVGDLAAIAKIESRRREVAARELGGQVHTQLLIDRYKYLDLLPCSNDCLGFMGYNRSMKDDSVFSLTSAQIKSEIKPSTSSTLSVNTTTQPTPNGQSSAPTTSVGVHLKFETPGPDPRQMVPFKPKVLSISGFTPLAGGSYAPPHAVAHLMQRLPPPNCFTGPFVFVDKLIESIRSAKLPEEYEAKEEDDATISPADQKRLNDAKKDMYHLLIATPDPSQVLLSGALKRKTSTANSDDETTSQSSGNVPRPIESMQHTGVDIYKQRLNKRLKT